MQFGQLPQFGRGRRTVTAVAVAVIGGLLGGAPGASAAPGDPSSPASATPERDAATPPAVWPRPRVAARRGRGRRWPWATRWRWPPRRTPTRMRWRRSKRCCARRVCGGWTEGGPDAGGRGPVVWMGGPGAQSVLRALRVPERGDLPSGGYRLATGRHEGRDVVALDGVGRDGLFHADADAASAHHGGPAGAGRGGARLARDGGARPDGRFLRPPVEPSAAPVAARLHGADEAEPVPVRARRRPVPAGAVAGAVPGGAARGVRELAERARRNHVTLAWAVAPAQAMCLASPDDVKALKRKVDAMYALGVRAFQVQFHDASYDEWHCGRDAEVHGRGPRAAATAHARVASELARHLAARYPDAEPLSLMPTESLPGRGDGLPHGAGGRAGPRGAGGVDGGRRGAAHHHGTGTGGSTHGVPAAPAGHHGQLPRQRLRAGPPLPRALHRAGARRGGRLGGAAGQRDGAGVGVPHPRVHGGGLRLEPAGYRPHESWEAALDDLAGGDPRARAALAALAGNDASSLLDQTGESAYRGRCCGSSGGPGPRPGWPPRSATGRPPGCARRSPRCGPPPGQLTGPAEGRLDDEVRPWLEQLARYGQAGKRPSTCCRRRRAATGGGVAGPAGAGAAAHGARGEPRDGRQGRAGPVPGPGREARPRPGRARRGRRARRTGRATPTPWTCAGRGRWRPSPRWPSRVRRRAPSRCACRVRAGGHWARCRRRGGPRPRPAGCGPTRCSALAAGRGAVPVRALVPWFADEPEVGLELRRTEGGRGDRRGAAAGGRGGVRAAPRRRARALAARAPEGVVVDVPKDTTVPRGTAATVPVTVTVPEGTRPGEYAVALSFGGEQRTLTVRAFRGRAAGTWPVRARPRRRARRRPTSRRPRRWTATGRPAGPPRRRSRPGGRWSCRRRRGSARWCCTGRTRTRRATGCRCRRTARTWRTAATVRDGRGGREAVRMDAPGARFVRLQLDARATEYGYSLYGVELYAVAP